LIPPPVSVFAPGVKSPLPSPQNNKKCLNPKERKKVEKSNKGNNCIPGSVVEPAFFVAAYNFGPSQYRYRYLEPAITPEYQYREFFFDPN